MAQAENDRRIDYIELGVADVERSKAFYGKAFAWHSRITGRPIASSPMADCTAGSRPQRRRVRAGRW